MNPIQLQGGGEQIASYAGSHDIVGCPEERPERVRPAGKLTVWMRAPGRKTDSVNARARQENWQCERVRPAGKLAVWMHAKTCFQ